MYYYTRDIVFGDLLFKIFIIFMSLTYIIIRFNIGYSKITKLWIIILCSVVVAGLILKYKSKNVLIITPVPNETIK